MTLYNFKTQVERHKRCSNRDNSIYFFFSDFPCLTAGGEISWKFDDYLLGAFLVQNKSLAEKKKGITGLKAVQHCRSSLWN